MAPLRLCFVPNRGTPLAIQLLICLATLLQSCSVLAYRAQPVEGFQVTAEPVPPSDEEQAKEFYQCTRQCRWNFGFFDLRIVGAKQDWTAFRGWTMCQCYRLHNESASGGAQGFDVLSPSIPRFSKKYFDTVDTWSGNDTSGFDSDYVCVQTGDGRIISLETGAAEEAATDGATYLHCGKCAACSSLPDIEVLSKTRKWITEVMTAASARFAAPWGHHSGPKLRKDLEKAGITFSEVRYDGRTDLPSCMDVWVDNIMCDSMACKSHCWTKFFNPQNPKTEITGKISWYNFNAKCLRCDEENCGPAFIKGAGANRRSVGLESDIKRPERQKCKFGRYSGVPEAELPTSPKPDV